MRELTYDEYYKRLRGCFIGKSVGGTLGMPYEGEQRLLNLTYYDPVPKGMVANDDLDLQVVWLESVRRHGLPVHRRYLADAWLENISIVMDEYGIARKNLEKGIMPPASGAYDNVFYAGMGAAIRSEVWACLCPGDPALAVSLAREDACVDHVRDGVEASSFLTALESAAFVEQDRERLLEIGFSFIPEDGHLSRVLHDTLRWWEECRDYVEVRRRLLEEHYAQNWTDVSLNLAFVLLGWYAGEGDFGKSLCATVNCGNDTDCTGASLGALLGILDPDGMGEEWTRPIGDKLVLSLCMVGMHEAETIDQFCEQIAALSVQVQAFYPSVIRTVGYPEFSELAANIAPPWRARPDSVMLEGAYSPRDSVVALSPVHTVLRHPEGYSLPLGQSREYELEFLGTSDEPEAYTLRLRLPDGWKAQPDSWQIAISRREKTVVKFQITAPDAGKNLCVNRLDILLDYGTVHIPMTAGLITSVAWLRSKAEMVSEGCPSVEDFREAQRVESDGHSVRVPAGRHLFMTEFTCGPGMYNAYLVAQGNRPLRVWLDGELVSESDGTFFVPAFHRDRPCARINIWPQWHRLVVEAGDGEEGFFFLGFGKSYAFQWIKEIEWRLLSDV